MSTVKKVQMEGDEKDTVKEQESTDEAKQEEQQEEVLQDTLPDEGSIQSTIKDEDKSEQVEAIPEKTENELAEDSLQANLLQVRKYSNNYFLNKHTPSFVCLEQALCSASDLLLTLNFFPPLTDPGLDDALNYISPEPEPDDDGCDKYINMCKDLTIVPIKRVINSLGTDILNLKYYGITLSQMRGISDALKVNSNVNYLILQDNWICPEQASLISDVLRESNSIRVLNMRECRVGENGAGKLCEGLSSTQFLQELDLSFNSLGDKGLQKLQQCLIENVSIKKLNISHNELTEDSGPILEQILLENKSIEELDLSWNGFYTGPGNKKLCNGLMKNEFISCLNLSWNGIQTGPAMRPITKYIRKTEVLQFLDLSWNRITQHSLKLLRAALIKNKSLQHIKIGNNVFTPDEAYFLASLFQRAKNDLTNLDMENMCVNKNFLQLQNQVRRKGKVIKHGRVLSNYEIFGPDINKLLFQRCRFLAMKPKKKKQKKDFGHFILSLPDQTLTVQDFQTLLKKKKVKKIDKDLLQGLTARFLAKNKKVDCVSMKNAYMTFYPDTVLPPEKKKKKKKKKGRKRKKKTKNT